MNTRYLAILRLVVPCLIVFAACAAPAPVAEVATAVPVVAPTEAPVPTTAPTEAPAPAPTDAPVKDTLLVTRISNMPTCYHPLCFETGNQYMNLQLVFNTLVKVDVDESTFIPDLADSWTVSADAKSFTFKLNPKAKWHDGTPVSSDDVIYTAATAAQMADDYVGTYPVKNWLVVDGADAVKGTANMPVGLVKVDDHTVTFNLAKPDAVWLRNLTDPAYVILPKHLLDGKDAATLKAADFTMGKGTIGSGPYKLEKFNPDIAAEYVANADYHKASPKISKIIYRLGVTPETAAAQLQSGELDMVFDLPPGDFDVLKDVAGIKVVRVPGVGQQSLQFPVDNPQVADKRIRQAIYYGFDRRTLLDTVFQGAGKLLWIWTAYDEMNPNLDQYKFDPEKAKELIGDAVKDGKFKLAQPIRVIYISDEPGWGDIAAALQNDLTALGLTVELVPLDGAGWQAMLEDHTKYEITLQCCGSNLYPDKASGAFSCEKPRGTNYANCELDKLFVDARETGDAVKQASIYAQIAEILNEDLPYNWLWAVANTHANSTTIGGFTYYPNARESFSQIEKWTLTP